MASKKTTDTGLVDTHRAEAAERRPRGGDPLEEVGPLPQRAAVGDGPRGLQPGRQRLGLLLARPVPLPRLPLGRGRPRRDLRRQAASVLRPRALERARSRSSRSALFGLTNSEGNHGEDVKEYYFYLDSTPTHSYMKYLYKYPQREFPYRDLLETNRRRTREELEYELLDTGIFDDDRYFDVFLEYAKAGPDDILIRVSVHNRGPEAARLQLLPTLWFRNTWSWGDEGPKPVLREAGGAIVASHPELGEYTLSCDGAPELLFTENETNAQRLWGQPNPTPYVKDAFHRYVIAGERDAVNPGKTGTKAAARYVLEVPAGGCEVVQLRLRARARRAGRSGRRSTRCSGSGSSTPTSSTTASPPARSARTSAGSTARRSRGCCGRSSTTTSTSTAG